MIKSEYRPVKWLIDSNGHEKTKLIWINSDEILKQSIYIHEILHQNECENKISYLRSIPFGFKC